MYLGEQNLEYAIVNSRNYSLFKFFFESTLTEVLFFWDLIIEMFNTLKLRGKSNGTEIPSNNALLQLPI